MNLNAIKRELARGCRSLPVWWVEKSAVWWLGVVVFVWWGSAGAVVVGCVICMMTCLGSLQPFVMCLSGDEYVRTPLSSVMCKKNGQKG